MSRSRAILTVVGVLVTLAGVIFTLQGIGLLKGSSMSGTTEWTILGPIIAVAGLSLLLIGQRAR
ncbi:MAG: hypothetical protein WCB85_07500 [Candidatus Dormiibacterota bacterium]